MRRTRMGFTLVELLVALAVLSVLSALVVPSVLAGAARGRMAEARALLTASVFGAQREATLRGKVVMLCPGLAGCRGDIRWSDGWTVIVDEDGDRAFGPPDRVLGRQPPLAPGVGLVSSMGRARLLFHPNAGNGGSNATFTLCERASRVPAQWLVLANDGRLRARPAAAGAAGACVDVARGRP